MATPTPSPTVQPMSDPTGDRWGLPSGLAVVMKLADLECPACGWLDGDARPHPCTATRSEES